MPARLACVEQQATRSTPPDPCACRTIACAGSVGASQRLEESAPQPLRTGVTQPPRLGPMGEPLTLAGGSELRFAGSRTVRRYLWTGQRGSHRDKMRVIGQSDVEGLWPLHAPPPVQHFDLPMQAERDLVGVFPRTWAESEAEIGPATLPDRLHGAQQKSDATPRQRSACSVAHRHSRWVSGKTNNVRSGGSPSPASPGGKTFRAGEITTICPARETDGETARPASTPAKPSTDCRPPASNSTVAPAANGSSHRKDDPSRDDPEGGFVSPTFVSPRLPRPPICRRRARTVSRRSVGVAE